MIEACAFVDQPGWLALRQALWPECSADAHLEEMAGFLAQPERYVQFIAYTQEREPVGLVEAAIRHDYVNGTDSSPVAFLEAIYVVPSHRRQGLGRELVAAVAGWARDGGCTEFASGAAVDNHVSQAVHEALGFAETERVIYYRRHLTSR